MSETPEQFAKQYLSYGEDALENELGARLQANAVAPAIANAPVGQFQSEARDLSLAGDLAELGGRLWRRMQKELYAVVCGDDAEDSEDRGKIKKTIGIETDDAVVGVIAGVLASSFGLAPAIAGIIAALVLKRIIKPGGKEFCAFWKDKLPE